MMTRYQFVLCSQQGRIPPSWAYRLYSWMLEQVPKEVGEALHRQGETPLVQFLCYDREMEKALWTVVLLSEEMERIFCPLLESCREIPLRTGTLTVRLQQKQIIASPTELIVASRDPREERCRTEMCFLSPTAFKKDGRYEIFPQIKLILQSLVNKWNQICPDYPLNDPEALEVLEQGLHLVDYSLRSTRYPLKNVKIPGFTGWVQVESKLPAPLEELWQMLLAFAPYAGIGIKTTLGMGGVRCSAVIKQTKPNQ